MRGCGCGCGFNDESSSPSSSRRDDFLSFLLIMAKLVTDGFLSSPASGGGGEAADRDCCCSSLCEDNSSSSFLSFCVSFVCRSSPDVGEDDDGVLLLERALPILLKEPTSKVFDKMGSTGDSFSAIFACLLEKVKVIGTCYNRLEILLLVG